MSSLTEVWPAVESLSEKEKRKLYDLLVRGFQGGVTFSEMTVDDSPVTKEERVRYFYPDIEDISRLVDPEIVVDPTIINDPSLRAVVERAVVLCKETYDQVAGPVRFEWAKQGDMLRLTISEARGFTASKLFSPDRLREEFGLGGEFFSLWWEILDKRTYHPRHGTAAVGDRDEDQQ